MSPPPSLIPRRLTRRHVAFGVLTLALTGVSGAAITLYLQREAIGVRLALDYLRAHGVPAELKLDRLDLGGVSGSLRLGPGAYPDLTVGRMEAEFGALPAPWRGGVRPPPIKALQPDPARAARALARRQVWTSAPCSPWWISRWRPSRPERLRRPTSSSATGGWCSTRRAAR